ncbi:MAG: hypothetical protein Q7J84_08095 [Sulfuricaulis sp.]|nr:hypothetical protein [Sulfuricaulis sp.]
MIRFINCLHKRADISSEQFRQYWNDPKFDAIVGRVVDYTGATGHAKNLTLIVDANDLMRQRRAFGEAFDGVLEYWWDNAAQLNAVLNSPQCDVLMKSMLDFQKQFVDLERSCAFFTEAQE